MPIKTRPLPSQEELKRLLRYEPETGKLYWKERSANECRSAGAARAFNTKLAGKLAFQSIGTHGYRRSRLRGADLLAHRVIWKLMTGDDPIAIDHINGQRLDNRWTNLREVTSTENARNAKKPSHNTSGVVGVSWAKRYNGWRAAITLNDKNYNLGVYPTFEEAVSVRQAAEKRHCFHPNHGRD